MKIEKIILSPGEKKPECCGKCGLSRFNGIKCDFIYYCVPLNKNFEDDEIPEICPITEQHVSTNPIPPNCTDPESLDNTMSEA